MELTMQKLEFYGGPYHGTIMEVADSVVSVVRSCWMPSGHGQFRYKRYRRPDGSERLAYAGAEVVQVKPPDQWTPEDVSNAPTPQKKD
jgi:hypothetical protein